MAAFKISLSIDARQPQSRLAVSKSGLQEKVTQVTEKSFVSLINEN